MRIWFNHWFSTAYNLINAIKSELKSAYIIGSSSNETAVYKLVCDEFYVEPSFETEQGYATWCLGFCMAHNIDMFLPRRGRVAISEILDKFKSAGIKVMLDDNTELIKTLDDKQKTAKLFQELDICKVPEILIATNVEEFKTNYKYLKNKYSEDRVCIKYVQDEGATSFRVIDDTVDTIASLKTGTGFKLSYQRTVDILSSVPSFEPLIQMIYLKGPEISIDSLMTSKGFIGCSRMKYSTRGEVIDPHSKLIDISRAFAEKTGIKYPYNLQIRWHNNVPYLLEVNTRMAGGTDKCMLAGINFPYLAVCELAGFPFTLPTNTKKVLTSKIETPLLIMEA